MARDVILNVPNRHMRRIFAEAHRSPQAGNLLTRAMEIWIGTVADYAALPVKDPNTLYLFVA